MVAQRVQGQIYLLFSHPTRLPVISREAVAKHNIDLRHQMLLNNTNILNCGVAHKGRERDEAALKQHTSNAGEQIIPKNVLEASLPFPKRKKASDVLIE